MQANPKNSLMLVSFLFCLTYLISFISKGSVNLLMNGAWIGNNSDKIEDRTCLGCFSVL